MTNWLFVGTLLVRKDESVRLDPFPLMVAVVKRSWEWVAILGHRRGSGPRLRLVWLVAGVAASKLPLTEC